ncbi:glycerophosphoryl diester phosphodiesterase membrane domain-containing protein [Paenibacillus yanchengensis]|uniref:Glycerophosphoryl diester phosphodiesterase membrane domain-containing protein n=1 Tax=Paenibacillus yanchengensis TaxID=2035833 RepID=A0ABW4YI68_9BACL
MFHILSKSLRDFRNSYKRLLAFEYLFMLLTSVIIIPVITFIFNRILMVVGSGSLLNGEVYRIGMSIEGVSGLIIIGLVASFALFIELCVLVIMIQQNYFQKKITMADALITTLRKTPRLLGFGFVQLLFFLLIFIPFIDSPLSESFYNLFNTTIFFQNKVLNTSFLMTLIYSIIVIVVVYVVLRWIFVLHFIMLEGQSITEAIRSSQKLTSGKRWRILSVLLLFNAVVLGSGILILTALSYLPVWLDLDLLKAFSSHYSLTISTILAYMMALLVMPINLIFLTRLYYYFNYGEGNRPQDRAHVYYSKLGKWENKLINRLKLLARPKLVIAVVAVIYVGITIFVGLRASEGLVYAKWNVVISAHRGDTLEAPENSLRSITAAIEKGYQSVEIDVQLTEDGVAVLHHDQTLKRLAKETHAISALSYAELGGYSIGKDSSGEVVYIASLYEALAAAKGKVKLLIDLKPYGPATQLVEEVVRQVKSFEMEEEVYVQAFDKEALRYMRTLEPTIKIGQVLYVALGNLTALDVDFYTIEQIMLTDKLVETAHAAGREVWVWTVNHPKNMKEVLKYRIDGLITDYPSIAQSMVELNL